MNRFKKTCLLVAFAACTDIGIQEIFQFSLLDHLFINIPWLSSLFHFFCLISGMTLLFIAFEREQ